MPKTRHKTDAVQLQNKVLHMPNTNDNMRVQKQVRHDKATILGILIGTIPFLVGILLGLILGQIVRLR
ncbi:MAG TPA: hypothetical protein VEP90_03775 [Methylomirabilota bacterium]|nr:hypothetical protein [Methylomirabilota bacterium]